MAAIPVQFEIDDTVLLCDPESPALLGRVERTYKALDSHDPVEDCLMYAYVPVAFDVLQQFKDSGRPPKGHVFVEFGYEECGYALLPEHSLKLISRAIAIGDTVKQDADSAMFGTVTDVESEYLLHPICVGGQGSGPVFTDPLKLITAGAQVPDLAVFQRAIPESLLSQVFTKHDLRRAEDYAEGDQIVSQDWFGIVEETQVDVAVLLLNGGVVWVKYPWELEVVVRNPFNKTLISWPEINDDIRRPDILHAHENGLTSIPPLRFMRGDLVVTNRRNLQHGRWLSGEHDPQCLPRGRVLDVRSCVLDINWLVPNAFVGSVHEHMPPNRVRPYENLTSFRHPSDLRRTKNLARYDHDRVPVPETAVSSAENPISTGDVYYPGDQVRLRDPTRHPSVPRISLGEIHGFDINEYRIFLGRHTASVLWQDGTTTKMETTVLRPYSLPESDLFPGDLVLAKDGLKMIRIDAEGPSVVADFNEMSFFEQNYTLVPSKVGVIQSMDSQERLARIRWFAKPDVKVGAFGQVLQNAQFGSIGDCIEDVSLYEIMTEPALVRKRGDMVIIPPLSSPKPDQVQHSFPAVPDDILAAHPPGPTTLSYLRQITSHVLPALWEIARPFADLVPEIPTNRSPTYDWIGEIVNISLEGSLTIRMGALKQCKDVSISQQDVLLIIDENAEYSDPVSLDDPMEIDDRRGSESVSDGSTIDEESDEASAIDETTEYDGGKRLDNESDEEDWTTEDEEDKPESVHQSFGGRAPSQPVDPRLLPSSTRMSSEERDYGDAADIVRITNAEIQAQLLEKEPGRSTPLAPRAATNSTLQAQQDEALSARLSPFLSQQTPPSSFEVMEQDPPPGPYNQAEPPTNSPAFLKRIVREHRILTSSLPQGEIYVRTYESRLDLLRCLIIGPADTPYEYCPFVVDLHLGPNYPKEPPKAHFHSWTNGLGRINPNLYEEGKICLSLLGTWPGQSEQEGWSDKATILQLLVSLQGLVFVSRPFYNEAGFETYGDERLYSLESQQYSEKAYVMARGFVKYALLNAPGGLEEVIAWLYLCRGTNCEGGAATPDLLPKVIQRARRLMDRSSHLKQLAKQDSSTSSTTMLLDGLGDTHDGTKTFLRPLSQGALVMLKKIAIALEDIREHYDGDAMETQ